MLTPTRSVSLVLQAVHRQGRLLRGAIVPPPRGSDICNYTGRAEGGKERGEEGRGGRKGGMTMERGKDGD